MPKRKTLLRKSKMATRPNLDPAVHRRILNFLNGAIQPQDLVRDKQPLHTSVAGPIHKGSTRELKRKKGLDPDIAKEILDFRDREFPLGFRNIKEVFGLKVFREQHLDILDDHHGALSVGSWSRFPQPIPRRGPGPEDINGVIHAALLHTGKVLFITADQTTFLWNPDDTTPATFEDPVNQPHQIPDTVSGYSVLCGGHSFLSDGRLLVVGGGGYGSHEKAKWGYKFDSTSRRWTRTAGSMIHHRWYPTVLRLGDNRLGNNHETLVVCGHGGGDMEIYDELTDTFRVIAGDDKPFPSLYPGLHLLPNHSIFYSRTGWGTAEAGGGPFPGDDQSSYFHFTGASSGIWNNIAPVTPSMPDRTKGMSVMLLSNSAPYIRVLVLGGSDPTNNNSYEIIDVTALSPASNWNQSMSFPDGERRSLASAVLLPDGNVFVCGGIQRPNSPCTMFDPQTNSWSQMAELPSVRDYHSVALLLPSGQVAMAGWNNTAIEIFNPPYLFRGARPVITSAPPQVHHGDRFTIASPDAATIVKVVLVRPMAVTHQTDTEQKILELSVTHDQVNPTQLILTAPHASKPHSYAQQGHYMMFAINRDGVPSVAKWIYCQVPVDVIDPDITIVPDVVHVRVNAASRLVRDEGLVPKFIGPTGQDAYVNTQRPKSGEQVGRGSTVTMWTKKGLIP